MTSELGGPSTTVVFCCCAADMLQRPPPGLSVLLSLMGGRQLEKALLHYVLGPGHAETEVRR
jgi:hypothetical protein